MLNPALGWEALGIGLSLLYLRQIGDVIFKFSSVAERRGGRQGPGELFAPIMRFKLIQNNRLDIL